MPLRHGSHSSPRVIVSTIILIVVVLGFFAAGIALIIIGAIRRGKAQQAAPCTAVTRTDIDELGVYITHIVGGIQLLIAGALLTPVLVRLVSNKRA